MATINMDMGVSWQAKALLAYLENLLKGTLGNADLWIQTWTYYNGRERGYCLEVRHDVGDIPSSNTLLLYFAEDRGTDGLFVQKEETDLPFTYGPSDYRTEESYRNRFDTDEGNIVAAGEYILTQIETFYATQKKAA